MFDGSVAAALLDQLPPDATLFVGNSLAIRHVDQFGQPQRKPLRLFANRGASGIDGNLSTFLGLLASQTDKDKQYGIALVGDLTFYHDMNGLLMCKKLSAMGYTATIIVINNNGGGIFNYLPQRQLNDFDKIIDSTYLVKN